MAEIPVFKFIDLFSGVGGMSLGFTGTTPDSTCTFKSRLMVDSDPEAREVARRNFPETPFLLGDIHQLSGNDLRKYAGLGADEQIHLLLGGPPCQGFSYLGKRALEDERNALVMDYFRLVRELKPLVCVMENVPLIMTAMDGSFVREICDGLSQMGYSSSADILTASDYGVPQLRKRAIVIAYRSELGLVPQFPHRTHERISAAVLTNKGRLAFESELSPYVSVEEAIGDLPSLRAGAGADVQFYAKAPTSSFQRWAREGSIAIFNHRSRAHAQKYLNKISIIKEGSRNAELPDDMRFSDKYFSQAYARLSRDGIAQTVTTCFGNPGSGRFLHYDDLRSITVREAARLQSFPDSFVFDGTLAAQMRHVGNAVPPLMARAIRNVIAEDLIASNAHKLGTLVGRPKAVKRKESREMRSRIMREVPSKNTSIEVSFRKALWAEGVRGYRLHDSSLPGHPDIVFPMRKVAVFIDGCFWHGCPKCYRRPNTNQEYWSMKVARNRERDTKVKRLCEERGWRVLRLWEHEVTKKPWVAVLKLLNLFARVDKAALRKSSKRDDQSRARVAQKNRAKSQKKVPARANSAGSQRKKLA